MLISLGIIVHYYSTVLHCSAVHHSTLQYSIPLHWYTAHQHSLVICSVGHRCSEGEDLKLHCCCGAEAEQLPGCKRNLEKRNFSKYVLGFSKNRPLGWFFHRVAMSVYISIYLSPFRVIFFEASYWPSGNMIRSWPLISPNICISWEILCLPYAGFCFEIFSRDNLKYIDLVHLCQNVV